MVLIKWCCHLNVLSFIVDLSCWFIFFFTEIHRYIVCAFKKKKNRTAQGISSFVVANSWNMPKYSILLVTWKRARSICLISSEWFLTKENWIEMSLHKWVNRNFAKMIMPSARRKKKFMLNGHFVLKIEIGIVTEWQRSRS